MKNKKTDCEEKLFEVRALLQAKVSSLVWRLVDMRGSGLAETEECRELMRNGMFIHRGTPEIHKRLTQLRSTGKNWSPRFLALKRVLEHWKRRLAGVRCRLEALGAI